MAETDSNLRSLFTAATNLHTQLDTLQANSNEYTLHLAATIASFTQCQQLADSLSLFSPNETADDITTGDLPYLSIDYQLASLVPLTPPSSAAALAPSSPPAVEERKRVLRAAQDAYADFLERLETYDLLDNENRRLLQRFVADKDAFEVLAAGGGSDPASRRGAKIARFKRERSLRQKVELFSHANTSDAISNNEDALRAIALTRLALQTHQAFHALDQLAQELRILALAAFAPAPISPLINSSSDGDQRARSFTTAYSERLDILPGRGGGGRGGSILDRKGKPTQPFVLLDARSREQKRVFQPGYSLPTMSIDEYLEAEKARGGIIDGGGETATGGAEEEINEDDMEAADRETEKQRAWDEFVEANPKGSGNTLNRG